MFYKKKGLPEESEIVMCTVTKILFHSVFVTIDEYENLEGMIHISEIAPGRIRNLRDYIVEGKRIVCKVLKVDQIKKQIDLSLRRVNLSQKIEKTKLLKNEEKAYKIIEIIAKKFSLQPLEIYESTLKNLQGKFEYLNVFFQKIAEDNNLIKEAKLKKEVETELLKILKDKIKTPEVNIRAEADLQTYRADGIEHIKKAIISAKSKFTKEIEINYVGAPRYIVNITTKDYKAGEKILEEFSKALEQSFKPEKGDICSIKKI